MSEKIANAFSAGECLLRHRGLSFRRPSEANLPKRDWHRPRVEFRHIPNSEARCQVFILRPDLANRRTQNDVRSRSPASPVSTIRFTDRKSPKFAYLPTA